MHSDSVYVIGDGHKVCEDYTRHGSISFPQGGKSSAYAVLSDGCSGSKDTDVGARVLAFSMERFLQQERVPVDEFDCHEIIVDAGVHARGIGLSEEGLDATLLGAVVNDNGCYVFGSGDGFLVLVYRAGGVMVYSLRSRSEYPFYLSYLLNSWRRVRVIKEGGWFVDIGGGEGEKIHSCYEDVGMFCEKVGAEEGKHIVAAVAFSDGIESFVDENRRPIPVGDIIHELVSFKGFKGQFAQRRMQAFLKSAKKRGWTHFDDLSMAAVCVEDAG